MYQSRALPHLDTHTTQRRAHISAVSKVVNELSKPARDDAKIAVAIEKDLKVGVSRQYTASQHTA